MKKIHLILLFLAACGRGDQPADNAAAPESSGPAAGKPTAGAARKDSPQTRLAGLYEGGTGPQKNQLCIVEKGKDAQFGLLVWGANLHSCSGAGQAIRSGDRLTLKMTGDETCTIEATLRDGTIGLPATLPTGCAYYCGARATLAGASFSRAGDDVKKAQDIAGDPLCD
jgi:hypothetical protein